MTPLLNSLDAADLPAEWRDIIADPEVGIVPRLNRALESENLSVYVTHDMKVLADIQARNAERMTRLSEAIDPDLNPCMAPKDFFAVVLTHCQERVGCTAIRFLWCEGTIQDLIEGGGLSQRPAPSRLHCDARTSELTESVDIAWSCGSFVQKGLPKIAFPAMIRLAFTLAFAKRRFHMLAGICDEDLALAAKEAHGPAWAFRTMGIRTIERGVYRVWPDGREQDYATVFAGRWELRELFHRPDFADPTQSLAGRQTQWSGA